MFGQNQYVRKPFSGQNLTFLVKVTKSNQLFPSSQICFYASLVKIHPLVQKITNRNKATWTPTNLTFQSAGVTLKIRPRSPKSNQYFPLCQQCIYASLVKIHPLVQKITHRNKATYNGRRRDLHQDLYVPLSSVGGGHKKLIQCSPFITHFVGYNTVMLWLPNFLSMEFSLRNYRKIIIKWSFSYASFVILSLYNEFHL